MCPKPQPVIEFCPNPKYALCPSHNPQKNSALIRNMLCAPSHHPIMISTLRFNPECVFVPTCELPGSGGSSEECLLPDLTYIGRGGGRRGGGRPDLPASLRTSARLVQFGLSPSHSLFLHSCFVFRWGEVEIGCLRNRVSTT